MDYGRFVRDSGSQMDPTGTRLAQSVLRITYKEPGGKALLEARAALPYGVLLES
jgi:hypothetical protein